LGFQLYAGTGLRTVVPGVGRTVRVIPFRDPGDQRDRGERSIRQRTDHDRRPDARRAGPCRVYVGGKGDGLLT
jgi:hypothetical protein